MTCSSLYRFFNVASSFQLFRKPNIDVAQFLGSRSEGPKDGWARLAKNLKAEIDDELIEAYRGSVSLPFAPGDHRRIAFKIVDDRGIESLKVVEIEE